MTEPLLDGNGGRESGDRIHIGPLKDFHILSNIGCEAFKVSALAFGKEDIKDEGRLAGSGYAGNSYQLLPRNSQTDVPEVVSLGTSYGNDGGFI
jgi:hypothetical protein